MKIKMPSRRRLKHSLTKKWRYKGGIYDLLRLLAFKPAFRIAFLASFALVLCVALFLSRVWKTTPGGFHPEIQISGLDWIQSRSLRRTALKWESDGQFEKAAAAWMAAFANHRADPDLARGVLRNQMRWEPRRLDRKESDLFKGLGHWLLRLSQTNRADLKLVSEVCFQRRWDSSLISLLSPMKGDLDADCRRLLLTSLLRTGDPAGYAAARDEWASDKSAAVRDPLLEACYRASIGDVSRRQEDQTLLARARSHGIRKDLATQLSLAAAYAGGDEAQYGTMLKQQETSGILELRDRLNYWMLLHRTGKTKEAIGGARAFDGEADTLEDAVYLIQVLRRLGEERRALNWLETRLDRLGRHLEIGLARAQLLISLREWEGLESAALQLRRAEGADSTWTGYSYYLEGLAHAKAGRIRSARQAWDKMAYFGVDGAELALDAASQLIALGAHSRAESLLKRMEDGSTQEEIRWEMRYRCALELDNITGMKQASRQLLRLAPRNPRYLNYRAAALILDRSHPGEAIQHTFQLTLDYPRSAASGINHAFALIQNGRDREAEELLRSIEGGSLTDLEKASVEMAWAEWLSRRGRASDALIRAREIDKSLLSAPQIRWLARIESK